MTGGTVGLTAAIQVEDTAQGGRLESLFELHHVRLYRLARRMMRSPDDARDLVQETFLRAARAVSAVPVGRASEEAWLVRILINLCRDGWRKRDTRHRLDERHLAGALKPALANSESALMAHTLVWQALRALPPRRRAAIVLYELEGASIPDIAAMMGVSAVTVRWHLSRGRRELGRIIEGKDRHEGTD